MSSKDYLFTVETERLTVLVPKKIKEKLATYVNQNGSSMSWVINTLLAEFLLKKKGTKK